MTNSTEQTRSAGAAGPSATGPGDETADEATEVSGDIEADGGRLHVEATGTGPAVVLLHGGSADSRMWQGQLAALAGHYRVIRYDLRGLGQSPPPAAPYRMSDDLTAVLDHLGVDSAALVGFSTGGAIALEFAARYPARAAALVLIGAIVPAEPGQIPGHEAARQELTLQLAPREAARACGDLAAAVATDLDVWASAHHGSARAELAAWGWPTPTSTPAWASTSSSARSATRPWPPSPRRRWSWSATRTPGCPGSVPTIWLTPSRAPSFRSSQALTTLSAPPSQPRSTRPCGHSSTM